MIIDVSECERLVQLCAQKIDCDMLCFQALILLSLGEKSKVLRTFVASLEYLFLSVNTSKQST